MRLLAVIAVTLATALLGVAGAVAGSRVSGPGAVDGRVVRLGGTKIQCIRAPCVVAEANVPVSFVRDGEVVARVRSGADGRFRVRLPVGLYVVRAPQMVPREDGKPRRVRVVAGTAVKLLVTLLAEPMTSDPRS